VEEAPGEPGQKVEEEASEAPIPTAIPQEIANEEPVNPLTIGEAIASVALEALSPIPLRDPQADNPILAGEPRPTERSESAPPATPYIIPPAEVYAGEELHMVTVILRTGYDKVRDNLRLRQCYGILISYSGHDRFALQIFERSRGYRVEFPNYTTTYCAELVARLAVIVGQDNIIVEPLRLH
jgi:hypothetical protein